MAPASTIMRRAPMVSSVLRRRSPCQALSSAAPSGWIAGRPLHLPMMSAHSYSSSFSRQSSLHQHDSVKQFSSLAQDVDDDDGTVRSSPLLPTRHSSNLPPPVCPPQLLRSEVESIFDAPIGSLIVYNKSDVMKSGGLKSVEEEMSDAYYASDAIVQRVEFIMRGLNACISEDSFIAKNLKYGSMKLEEEGGNGETLEKDECFSAMMDLMKRMHEEGDAYEDLRTRVRSQLVDPSSGGTAEDDSSSSDDSSDSDSSSDEEEGEMEEKAENAFSEWATSMEENMSKAGYKTSSSMNADSKEDGGDDEISEEMYQFGANPGVTTHMYDLVLDSLACLCQEQYGSKGAASVNLAELMPEDTPSPPELAKDILDIVLNNHWIDGGDIGLGGGGKESAMYRIAQGVGTGAGTGAGGLAGASPFDLNYDTRTCPTPMTFNAVIRVAANFDPATHIKAVENAMILSGNMGNAASSGSGSDAAGEQERLRDVTLDAALSTYSRMLSCSALTLRSIKASSKRATSRQALKRQARLLNDTYKKKNGVMISGRNAATYAYVIQTLTNCIPPSLSRGNMTYALWHKGCVEEGVLDRNLVEAMRGVGGYTDDGEGEPLPPPISNGAKFDDIVKNIVGAGVDSSWEQGRSLRYERNYKMRRHVEWDDTY